MKLGKAIALLFFLLPIASIPTTPKYAVAQSAWTVEKPPHPSYSNTYKASHRSGVCYVNILKDEPGITLIASENTKSESMMEQVNVTRINPRPKPLLFSSKYERWLFDGYEFSKPPLGSTSKENTYLAGSITASVYLKGPYEEAIDVPDLFKAHCLDQAKLLPSEIRKLFFGYDGIQ